MSLETRDPRALMIRQADALRVALGARSTKSQQCRAARSLKVSLLRWCHSHPRAGDYVLDAQEAFERLWFARADGTGRQLQPTSHKPCEAITLMEGMLALDDSLGSQLVAVTAMVLSEREDDANRRVVTALTKHGTKGSAGGLLLWHAFLRSRSGDPREAIDAYREISCRAFGPVRVTGTIAGALMARSYGAIEAATAFIDRLGDEDPAVVAACAHGLRVIRRRRDPDSTIDMDLRWMRRRAVARGVEDAVCYSLFRCVPTS